MLAKLDGSIEGALEGLDGEVDTASAAAGVRAIVSMLFAACRTQLEGARKLANVLMEGATHALRQQERIVMVLLRRLASKYTALSRENAELLGKLQQVRGDGCPLCYCDSY